MQKFDTTSRWLVYFVAWVYIFPGISALKAQVAPDPSTTSAQTASVKPRELVKPGVSPKQDRLLKKYDITKIGARSIGTGLNLYSLEREARLGEDLASQIDASVRLNTNPIVHGYINKIALKLEMHSDSRIPIKVKVVYDAQPNAFAVPGGYLYVTTGLLLFCDDEAELAGAMAHEIAHVAARHGTKTLTKKELWGFASIPLSMIGGPVGAAVSSFTSVAGPLSFLKLGRNEELEADLLGIEYLYLAGYDPLEFIKFFEKTKMTADAHANFFGKAFATHPQAEDRIRRAQSEVQILLPPRAEYILDTNDFQEVKSALADEIAGKAALEKPVLLYPSADDSSAPAENPQD